GIWFDSIKPGETPENKRSSDVFILRGGATGGGGLGLIGATTPARTRQAEPPEPLVIEILTIEMKDPTGG
ncbi:MAG TPA: hypothetical protein VJL29_01660, partial [Thermoguttaceae bacterium]|nr:hypothetical protein [Thermoguttaceae bacterium]